MSWHAVYTRSRHEKLTERLLTGGGFETYLPLRRTLNQWKDRRTWVDSPLFPGYLFVRSSLHGLPEVRRTKGVVTLVGKHTAEPYVVPDEELDNVRRLVETDVRVDPYPYLQPGTPVRIKRGTLQGVEGIVMRKARKYFLVVSVDILGRSAAAEIPADCVETV